MVVVLLALVLIAVPRLLGWVPLTVMSGSMEPQLPTGSLVVLSPVTEENFAQVAVGDVITLMPYPDDDTLVTHRVVAQAWRADGERILTTRGDANGADDPWQVTAQQARGVARYHVPYAGYLTALITDDVRRAVTVGLAAGLFGYAAWQLVPAARGRGRQEA